jgi:hypothetical protein
MALITSVIGLMAGLLNSPARSQFNAARSRDGKAVKPPSGNRFARMTKADAEWYQGQINAGAISNLSPFGALVIAATLQDTDWRPVRKFLAESLALPNGKLGPWNEDTKDDNVIRSGLQYAYCQARAAGV